MLLVKAHQHVNDIVLPLLLVALATAAVHCGCTGTNIGSRHAAALVVWQRDRLPAASAALPLLLEYLPPISCALRFGWLQTCRSSRRSGNLLCCCGRSRTRCWWRCSGRESSYRPSCAKLHAAHSCSRSITLKWCQVLDKCERGALLFDLPSACRKSLQCCLTCMPKALNASIAEVSGDCSSTS
jgi:hypothetical protein